jgi:flagellar biosynthetic protein FlhB
VSESATEKTEKATPERRNKAREQGEFARSRDGGGVAAALATTLALSVMGKAGLGQLHALSTICFGQAQRGIENDGTGLLQQAAATFVSLVLPAAFAAAVAATAVGFAQAGFHPRSELLMPNWGRLDPGELVQSLLRVGVVGYVVYRTIADSLPRIMHLAGRDLAAAASELARSGSELAVRSGVALAVLAAADYGFSKFQLEKRLMMSRQDMKDEMRQSEGDPRIKARQRARARERLKRGLLKQVKQSDVIVANPTHVSVALRYRAKDGAPVVMAKGYDEIALHIQKLAREAGIPIIENRVLARSLAARVRAGKAIPADLYAAVAEVLAFVYRLRRRTVVG